ncbi:hypothetical protein EVAR_101261_1 [Eumeta japonica]|uniref:Uncharacterized protein n=1 Tax=Eumeta variegata TaxID=151549 RepID=A0A4C1SNU6_EUMVA|nr:hypothetical protein EVAR_101261_1 [Eumeta japonica]
MTQQKYRGGAGNFANDPERASEAGSAGGKCFTSTKNSGTKNRASTVPASVPPMIPVPMAMRLLAPAPVATASGITPAIKASEVIIIGRRRVRAASNASTQRTAPTHRILGKFDNQYRILDVSPTVVSNATRK